MILGSSLLNFHPIKHGLVKVHEKETVELFIFGFTDSTFAVARLSAFQGWQRCV